MQKVTACKQLLSTDNDFYVTATLTDCKESLENLADKIDGFFTYETIQKVPYIGFPRMSQEENKYTYQAVRETLIISKRKNHYKEVLLAYNIQTCQTDGYIKILGDEHSASFYSDAEIISLFKNAKKHSLNIINIHNHPSDSIFSIADLLIFSSSSKIGLFIILNTNGDMAFLYKADANDIAHEVSMYILEEIIANGATIKNWKDVLSVEQQMQIVESTLQKLEHLNIFHSGWFNQTNQKEIEIQLNDFVDTIHNNYGRD